jgi:hypothetical protein
MAAICAGPAGAADPAYPVKPIRMIIANVAGGTSDILARVIGAKLTESWGQQIIVDNRPGASGLIGNELLVKAPPDGYTLLMADFGSTTTTVLMHGKATIDLQRDYAPVTIVSYSPHLFCVHPSVPANNVKAVIALAKAQPGKLNFATAGQTTAPHWAGILLASRYGIDWTYIPGKGGAQAVLDVASGQAYVRRIRRAGFRHRLVAGHPGARQNAAGNRREAASGNASHPVYAGYQGKTGGAGCGSDGHHTRGNRRVHAPRARAHGEADQGQCGQKPIIGKRAFIAR